jgi:hypothetical protein
MTLEPEGQVAPFPVIFQSIPLFSHCLIQYLEHQLDIAEKTDQKYSGLSAQQTI